MEDNLQGTNPTTRPKMLPPEVLAELESLLARVRANEPRALEQLIAKALPYIKGYLFANSSGGGARAVPHDDLIMDAAAKAARSFPKFHGTSAPSFLKWLKTIVVNLQIDATRWQARKKRTLQHAESQPAELLQQSEAEQRSHRPSERLDAIETWLAILSALLELPTNQREAFWLHKIRELSQEEVSAKLGRNRGMVAGEINRARKALANVLRRAEQTERGVAPVPASGQTPSGLPMDAFLLADRFELGAMVSADSTHDVHQGQDRRSGQPVAINLLNYEHCSSIEVVARFINESFWLGSIADPNVCLVLSGGMLRGGRPYLVQEWLPVSLADVLQRGPLHPAAARIVIQQVVRAIGALHTIGLVHRDISPTHFRMSRWEEGSPEPQVLIKLTSLRLAKPVAKKTETPLPISTLGSVLPGALEYRAPDLWLDAKQADEKADVYSIGALWYALLTGRPPFERGLGESVQSLMQRCVYGKPVLERIPQPDPLLERLLSKSPLARPSLTELCAALNRAEP